MNDRRPTARTLSVLLVEDNDDDVEAVTRVIERSGVDAALEIARDGEQAIERLAAGDRAPGLVLLDLRLPRTDGFEVLRRMKGDPRLAALPVVVLSGTGSEEPVRLCMELGTNMYITKPLDIADIFNIITSAHRYWSRTDGVALR